jgi:hypothetical protein
MEAGSVPKVLLVSEAGMKVARSREAILGLRP